MAISAKRIKIDLEYPKPFDPLKRWLSSLYFFPDELV
jgi:hypothetical protein